jgi:hypothetical protein
MKRTLSVVAVTLSLIVTMAVLATGDGSKNVPTSQPKRCFSPQFQADGGTPVPPWPHVSSALSAEGTPAPPWPHPGSALTADGGTPAPPWPWPTAVLMADGGTPAPPWPPIPQAHTGVSV